MTLTLARQKFHRSLASLPTLHLFAAPPPDVLALVQSILEEFYTDGIDQVVSADLNDKGDIVGEFIDQVGARQVKRYTYRIADDDVAFKLLNPNEVSNFSFESFKPLFGKGSKAGQKKSCRKGTPCGGTCISATKACHKAPGSASKAKIQEAKQKLGGGAGETEDKKSLWKPGPHLDVGKALHITSDDISGTDTLGGIAIVSQSEKYKYNLVSGEKVLDLGDTKKRGLYYVIPDDPKIVQLAKEMNLPDRKSSKINKKSALKIYPRADISLQKPGHQKSETEIKELADRLVAQGSVPPAPTIIRATGKYQYEVVGNSLSYEVQKAAGLSKIYAILIDTDEEKLFISKTLN